jgi:hypothetical protein
LSSRRDGFGVRRGDVDAFDTDGQKTDTSAADLN